MNWPWESESSMVNKASLGPQVPANLKSLFDVLQRMRSAGVGEDLIRQALLQGGDTASEVARQAAPMDSSMRDDIIRALMEHRRQRAEGTLPPSRPDGSATAARF